MNRSSLAVLAILLASIATPALAQIGDDEVTAMSVAITAFLTKFPSANTTLVHNSRSADLAKRLSAKIGKRIDHECTMLTCQDDPKLHRQKCALKNGGRLVNLGSVAISGDAARAYLYVEHPTDSELQPVETLGYVVYLARVKGEWTVVDIRLELV